MDVIAKVIRSRPWNSPLARQLTGFSSVYTTSNNIAPSQPVAAIRCDEQGRELVNLRWRLIPSWLKTLPKVASLIYTRTESDASKPSFRAAYNAVAA